MSKDNGMRLGWIGAGRMGFALASRLLAAGHDLAVYNRTRAKAEPLADLGATIVDAPAQLADRDIVFTMVGGPDDLREVVLGAEGLLSGNGHVPRVIVDSTTVSPASSDEVRAAARARERQPQGRRRRPTDDRRLRARGCLGAGASGARAARRRRDLRRRRRARAPGHALPQPHA